ncbi:MAG TPA: tocopherol cyclase family protein [Acidimicrobiales bacterium]|nr:tocopherol cyclase family protein [Acidimicrobiales bacterium]
MRLADRYRRTGADLPGGDPRPSHGAEMEGYFWRCTDVATGRVVVALCGVNRSPSGPWATVAVAAHPGGFVRSVEAPTARADGDRYRVEVPGVLEADAEHLHVDLGPGARLDLRFAGPFRWPLRTAGGGVFSALPFLGQYWHPHVLDAAVTGEATVGGPDTWSLDGARLYAEKNWGRGFPEFWWWGQAQGFSQLDVTVAFTGGVLQLGPVAVVVGGIVVRLGERVIRLTPPLVRMAAEAGGGRWFARGRGHGVEVEVRGQGRPEDAHVLPVPVPAERRNVASDWEHLAGRLDVVVRERGRLLFEGTSHLAGLEIGFRPGHPAITALGPAGVRIRSASMSPRRSSRVLTGERTGPKPG